MLPLSTRALTLPPDRMREVLDLLAADTRETRLRAAQILARAYDRDEEVRLAEVQGRPAADDEDAGPTAVPG